MLEILDYQKGGSFFTKLYFICLIRFYRKRRRIIKTFPKCDFVSQLKTRERLLTQEVEKRRKRLEKAPEGSLRIAIHGSKKQYLGCEMIDDSTAFSILQNKKGRFWNDTSIRKQLPGWIQL